MRSRGLSHLEMAQALVDAYVVTPESILSTDSGKAFSKVGKQFQLHPCHAQRDAVGADDRHSNWRSYTTTNCCCRRTSRRERAKKGRSPVVGMNGRPPARFASGPAGFPLAVGPVIGGPFHPHGLAH